jgi:hypothetical protein
VDLQAIAEDSKAAKEALREGLTNDDFVASPESVWCAKCEEHFKTVE